MEGDSIEYDEPFEQELFPRWFQEFANNEGLDLKAAVALDPETREYLHGLDEEGQRSFIEHARTRKNTLLYRGRRITESERHGLIQQIGRLAETGGEWDSDAPDEDEVAIQRIGDRPNVWIDDELEYLESDS